MKKSNVIFYLLMPLVFSILFFCLNSLFMSKEVQVPICSKIYFDKSENLASSDETGTFVTSGKWQTHSMWAGFEPLPESFEQLPEGFGQQAGVSKPLIDFPLNEYSFGVRSEEQYHFSPLGFFPFSIEINLYSLYKKFMKKSEE